MKSKEKRDTLVGVLVTETERRAMQRLTDATGATASSLMRALLLRHMQETGVMPEIKSGGLVSQDRPAAAQ